MTHIAAQRTPDSDAEFESLFRDPFPEHLESDNPKVSIPVKPASYLAPTISTADTSRSHSYSFPNDRHVVPDEWEESQIKTRLDELLHSGRGADQAGLYALHRKEICALHIRLNERRRWTPRFRGGMPAIGIRCAAGSVGEMIGRDRQVIDLHWLHCTGYESEVGASKYVDLFDGGEFDFSLAEEFACENWKADTKVDALAIDDAIQWQLAALQSKRIQESWKALRNQRNRILVALKNSVSSSERHMLPHVSGWADVELARRILATISTTKPATPNAVAKLVGFMTGKPPISDTAMRNKMKSVTDRLS